MTRLQKEVASPTDTSLEEAPHRITVSSEAERRAHVGKWIARHQKTATAALGTAMLFLPVVAGAQTQGEGLVNAAAIDGVRDVQLRADGSAQVTLDNGSILNISAQDVVTNAAGDVLISQQVAGIVTDAVAGGAAAGGGVGGVLAAGAAAGVAGLAGAGAGGGGGDSGTSGPAPVVFNAEDVAGFSTFSDVFGREPEGDPDRITITMGEGGDAIVLTDPENRDPETGAWTLPENFAENFEDTEGEVTFSFTAEREVPPEEEDGDGDPVVEGEEISAFKSSGDGDPEFEEVDSGTVTLLVDTVAPTISIDMPIAGDDGVLNIAESGEGLTITGTTVGAEDGQVVTLTLDGETYTGSVSGDMWSVEIPATDLSDLLDGAAISVEATVADAAGNSAEAPDTATFGTDFTPPTITLDSVDEIGALEARDGLEITGTTTGAEDGQVVAVIFDGQTFKGNVAADMWSVTVPETAVKVVRDRADENEQAQVDISATVEDVAGNPAETPATLTVQADFTGPSITIDPITGDDVINIAERDDAGGITISGTTGNVGAGQDVTVTVGGVGPIVVQTGTDGSWSATLPQADAGGLADGASVDVTANVDDADGIPADPASVTLTTDFTAPTISIDTPIAGDGVLNIAEQAEILNITGTTTGAEDGQVVTLTLDGKTYTATVGENAWSVDIPSADLAELTDGANVNVEATVEDAAGNKSEVSESFTSDFTAPEVTIAQLQLGGDTTLNAAESESDLVITGTATDSDKVTVTFNGEAQDPVDVTDGDWSITISSTTLQGLGPDATIEIGVEAMDDAGNIGEASTSFTTDFTPPTLTVDPLAIGDFLNVADASGEVTVTGSVSDHDGENVIVSVGGQDVTAAVDPQGNWTASFAAGALSALEDGSTEFTVSTQDTAGNESSATSQSFTVDQTPPDITVDDPPEQPFVLDVAEREDADGFGFTTSESGNETVTLTFTRNDGSGIVDLSLTEQLGNIPDVGGVFDFPLTPSNLAALEDLRGYTVEIGITDAAGNAGSDSFDLTTDFEPFIFLDEIGIDGAIDLSDVETPGISGTTTGVEEGQQVTVVVTAVAGELANTTVAVQADGTWSLPVDQAAIAALQPGETFSITANVTNADGRAADEARADVDAYLEALYVVVNTAENGATLTMSAIAGDGLDAEEGVQTVMAFDTARATYVTGSDDDNLALFVVNSDNADFGTVTFGGGTTSGQVPEGDVLYSFDMEDQGAGPITLSFDEEIQGGPTELQIGTSGADTLTAAKTDSVIQGKGGDDSIDVSATGTNIVVFELDQARNGTDTVTGFTTGNMFQSDVIAFLGEADLRGAGDVVEALGADGTLGVDTGFVIFTNALADIDAATLETAFEGLTGENMDDEVYFLAGNGNDAALTRATVNDTDDVSVEILANFMGIGDLGNMSTDNVILPDPTGT